MSSPHFIFLENVMKRFIICIVLCFLLAVETVGATVLDTKAPYFGDYLFVYNPTDSEVSFSPAVSASVKSMMLRNTVGNPTDSTEQLHWSPDYSDLSLKTDLIESTMLKKRDSAVLYAASSSDVGDTLTYLVTNPQTNVMYYQDFIYQASGQYCNILVEPDANGDPKISVADAQKLVTEFDTNIQPFMVTNFGDYYTEMWLYLDKYLLTSKNQKMDILLYDIQDGYNGTTNRSYVGGYTDLTDFISTDLGGNGNERGILHIDIYPLMGTSGEPDIEKAYSTIVHEFQHQISYSDSLFDYFIGKTSFYINDAWWNEAFSMAAEHLYTGKPLTYRLNSYNQVNNSTPLRNGLVLGYLDYSENNNNVASNYSTSYLFGQYLRCQTKHLTGGGNQIYRTVLEQVGTDYTAILAGLSSIGYEHTPSDFEELYRNFRMATILKNPTGPYGFAGEDTFSGLSDNAYTGTAALTLKPGAAVVLAQPENFTPSNTSLSYVSFSNRGDFTYDLNAVSDTMVNLTHGDMPEGGVTFLAAGYDIHGKLLGTEELIFVEDQENYPCSFPEESVTRKCFLFTGDGSLRPLSYVEIR